MRKELFLLWCIVYVCGFSFYGGAQVIRTIGGNGTAGYVDSVAATSGELNFPWGVAIDTAHNVYVADFNNSRLRKINASGGIITLVGNGSLGYDGDGGVAYLATVNQPQDVTVTRSGVIYIADAGNNVIRKISTAGIISTYAGTGVAGFSGDGGPATSAQLDQPTGIALDRAGNLYITDYNNYRVRKIDTFGTITTIAGNGFGAGIGSGGYTGDGGPATAAELFYPTDVTVDAAGNVYIADELNNVVRKVNTSGIISTVAGTGIGSFSGDGGLATAAQLLTPSHVAVDTVGNLYISDEGNNRIRKVNTLGIINTIAGTGVAGFSGDNGSALLAKLNHQQGIAVDGSGKVYIADESNSRIRVISSSGYFPSFTGGASQAITICENSGEYSLDLLLAIRDSDVGQAETWTISSLPAHGTLGGFSTALTSNGDTITPSGLTYTPATGYTGTDVFTIKASDGRTATTTTIHVTVNPLPTVAPISGLSHLCILASISLTDAIGGGLWSTTGTGIALTGSGELYAVETGIDTVYYVVANSCGSATAKKVIMVYPLADAGVIVGNYSLCAGTLDTLSSASFTTVTDSGGVWSVSNPAATINSITGVLSGITPDTVTVFYTVINGCDTAVASQPITINTIPNADTILGFSTLCQGYALLLVDTATGGIWYSSNSTASVAGGLVMGLSGGVDTVSYIVTNACGADTAKKKIVIDSLPVAGTITGVSAICAGASAYLADAASGGEWSTTNSAAAVTGGGEVIVITGGVDTIRYVVTNSCSSVIAIKVFTIDPLPDAGSITGDDTVCQTQSITLADSVTGGIWSSRYPALASVTAGGMVSGLAPGIDTIFYSVTNACGTTKARLVLDVRSALSCGLPVGVNEVVPGLMGLGLFPNPSDGSFTFHLTAGENEPVQIIITNVAGEKVKELTTFTNKQTEVLLNVVPGMYLLSATTAHGRYMAKIMVN